MRFEAEAIPTSFSETAFVSDAVSDGDNILGVIRATACNQDGKSSRCDAPVVKPQPETCNAIDDDCDGVTDEDSVPAAETSCVTGKVGVCRTGVNQCVNGKVRCVQDVQQGAEICNKLDDDCDGRVDNDCVSESAAAKHR